MFDQCRSCLNTTQNMKLITETEADTKQLMSMYKAITGFEWVRNDKIASHLCNECESMLRKSYEFRKKCLDSWGAILERLKSEEAVNVETESEFIAEVDLKLKPKIEYQIVDFEEVKLEGKENNHSNKRKDGRTVNNYCLKCGKKVRSLSIHLKKFHPKNNKNDPEKYACYVCTKELKSAASLRAHLKVHEGTTPHKCAYCGKPHKNRGQLIEHERTHTGEKPHICSFCGKAFAQAGALSTHMKIHTGRPEVCTICQKRFCRPSELKLHLRKHSGEKPFLCTECGKAFIQKSHLMEHMHTHSELRPFRCMYCDKAFKQKSLLTSHLQIHSGYKPFQCKLCEYACMKAYRLRQHMKLHDNQLKKDKIHQCPVCEKSFTTQAMLNSHVTSLHNAIL